MNSWFDRFQTRKTYLEKSTLNNYLKSLESTPALLKDILVDPDACGDN